MKKYRQNHASWVFVALLLSLLLLAFIGGCSEDDETYYSSQGSKTEPYNLDDEGDLVGSPPLSFEGTVGTDPSYYQVTATDLTAYFLTLSDLRGDADLLVYSTNDFDLTSLMCASVSYGTSSEYCLGTPVAGLLFIMVPSHYEYGTRFTLYIDVDVP